MKKHFLIIFLILSITAFSTTAFAEENIWEAEFKQALQKGKLSTENASGGLGYTQPENIVLKNALYGNICELPC